MSKNNQLEPTFGYLKAEGIPVDEQEFELQFSSHPDYPSLLATSDTLNFFNITNAAFRIEKEEISLLPTSFIAEITKENQETDLHFVTQNNEHFIIHHFAENKSKNLKTKEEFQQLFTGLVLLAEQNETIQEPIKQSQNIFLKTSVFLITLFLTLFLIKTNLFSFFFALFSCFGIYLSILALKDLFGTENKILANFCNGLPNLSCDSVIQSNKWKIFEKISFSDLSLVFFASQLLGLFFFSLAKEVESYLFIQKIVLFGAIPIIGISLYYQKFVEKKWCPICLMISGVLILELIYLIFNTNFQYQNFNSTILLYFIFVFLLVISLWIPLKNLLKKQKEFKEKSLKLTRFSRNYTLFKNTLLSTEKKNFESTNPLTLGNKEAKLHIAVVTSPYCGHCKEAHEILYKIAIKHPENVKVSIFYNTPIGKEEDRNQLFRSLVSIYQTEGQECYSQAVKELYETKDYNKYKELKIENPDKIDEIINGQAHSCFENKIHFTPAIFINGYEYPKMYERKELAFFIPDLIDDEF